MGRNSLDINEEDLKKALLENPTQATAGEALGISQASVCNYIKKFGIEPKLIRKTPEIASFKMPAFDWDKLKKYLFDLQNTEEPTVGYSEVDIEIETDRPIELDPLGDLHIGSRWNDYKGMIDAVEHIAENPVTFTMLAGDFCDNYNTSAYKGGQIEERIPIQMQKAIAEEIIKKLSPNVLALVQGCHDEWSFFNDGFDLGKYLADRGDSYYLGHNGFINLLVGDVKYRIFLTHNTYRRSTINDGHGLRSALKEHGDFDIGICAHEHKPHVETFVLRGERKWIMTCGSFKGQDRFASKGGFPPTLYCTPGMILDNKKKNVIMDIDYRNLGRYI